MQTIAVIEDDKLVLSAVCILLILMGLINYINVTATGFASRRKEFAVLESIGLTTTQLRKMLLQEGIFYSLIILILSGTLGSGILCLMGKLIKKRLSYFVFEYPLTEFLICCVGMFAICIAFPLFMYRRHRKESIVERLRIYAD